MRVLQINTEATWRGGERQTLYTLDGLRDAGAETGVDASLLCRRNGPLAARATQAGHTVHEVGSTGEALAFLARQGRGYDLLHAQAAKAQTLAVLTKPLHRRPLVYTRRVDFVPSGLPTRLKYAATDRTVAISRAIARILTQSNMVRGKVPVIPSVVREEPADPEATARIRREHGLEGKLVLGCVAALVPHKDPLTLARALALLSETMGERARDVVCLHLGEGTLRPELEAEIARLGTQDRHRLLGFQPQVRPFFDCLDGFVVSSREEGLGSTVLDAFLYNVPVAGTTAGGLAELLTPERALACPPEDPRALAAILAELLTKREAAAGRVLRAREHVLAEHTLDRHAARYLQLYQDVLATT